MKWLRDWVGSVAIRVLSDTAKVASRQLEILDEGGWIGDDYEPVRSLRQLVVESGRTWHKLSGEDAVRADTKIANEAQVERDKLKVRTARLEQFHCEHEFAETSKGVLESLFCVKCDSVHPGWRLLKLPVDLAECDWVEWEHTNRGWRPHDRRAIFASGNYYVPTTPLEEDR